MATRSESPHSNVKITCGDDTQRLARELRGIGINPSDMQSRCTFRFTCDVCLVGYTNENEPGLPARSDIIFVGVGTPTIEEIPANGEDQA